MSKRELPEVNAGSMADIAFLLLIFFLVTTTMDVDNGILRKIPPKQDEPIHFDINARNILEIDINKNNELFVDDKVIHISDLKEIAINFIDNGVGLDINKKPCSWCKGKREVNSSEHPTKAIISITSDREANYETYISIIDNVNAAYSFLRNRLSTELYKTSYNKLLNQLDKKPKNKEEILQKIKTVRSKYPLLISDAEIQH